MPPELYGKCRELGYCDCGGFLGCSDPDGPGEHATDEPTAPSRASLQMTDELPGEDPGCRYCRRLGRACVRHGGTKPEKPAQTLCEDCGKIKRSNHVCLGKIAPPTVAVRSADRVGELPLSSLTPADDNTIGPSEDFDERPEDDEPEPRKPGRRDPFKPLPQPETTRFMRQDSRVIIELPNLKITIEPTCS